MAPNDQHSAELTPEEVEELKGDIKSSCGSIAERFQVEGDVSRKSKGWRKLAPNLPIMLVYALVVVAGTGFWIAKERGLFGFGSQAEAMLATSGGSSELAVNGPHETGPENTTTRGEPTEALPAEPEELSASQEVVASIPDKPASAIEIGTGGKLTPSEAEANVTIAAAPEYIPSQDETAQAAPAKEDVLPIQTESVVAKPAINSVDERPAGQTLALIKQGEYLVQLASVRKLALVEPGWKRFQTSHEALLSDLTLHTEEADISGKTFYRIQTGPFASKAAAIDFCKKLKARDQDCFVTKKAN